MNSDDREKHIDRLALGIAGMMHGLDIADIEQVLTKASIAAKLSVRLDVTGPHFRRHADKFEQHYGEPVMPPIGPRQ